MSEKVQQLETAFKSIAVLNQLILETGAARGFDELTFIMLNRSISYCNYDRAVLVTNENGSLIVRGISGVSTIQPNSEFAHSFKRLLKHFTPPEKVSIVNNNDFSGNGERWKGYASEHNGTAALWMPLKTSKGIRGGIWLERWESKVWTDDDATRIAPLAVGYSHSFEHCDKPRFGTKLKHAFRRKRFLLKLFLIIGVIGAAMATPVPLRVVAPCEVVADSPHVIAAPLGGVVKRVTVTPGSLVNVGDILFEYEPDVYEKTLKESVQKVEVIKASLTQNLAVAFDDPQAKSRLLALQSQLKEENARLDYARYQNSHLTVSAQHSGVVVLENRDAWTGRPVSVGEQIMQVVDPSSSKVRVWISAGDKISFDRSKPVKVVLEAQPGESYSAQLHFDNSKLEMTPDGRACFRAEAQWNRGDTVGAKVKIGQTGTAILYGENVPLAYWLFRRPLNALRSFVGW